MTPQIPPPSNIPASEVKRVAAGGGRITLAVHGTKAIFEELSAAYPLKLLSPQVYERAVAIVYLLSYGGGLVAGDRVDLDVELKDESKLLVLSQVRLTIFLYTGAEAKSCAGVNESFQNEAWATLGIHPTERKRSFADTLRRFTERANDSLHRPPQILPLPPSRSSNLFPIRILQSDPDIQRCT